MMQERQIPGFRSVLKSAAFGLGLVALGNLSLANDRFLMQDGFVAIEVESQGPNGWDFQTSPGGFTGSGFLRWTGSNLFDNPGTAILTYEIEVPQGGNYRLSLRNRHEDPDSTEHNDTWVRMNGGQWIKLFSNGPGTVANWNWDSRFDFDNGGPQPNANFDLFSGVNTLEFSARSFGFGMDRVHIYTAGHPDGTNESVPQSPCIVGNNYCSANANSTGASATTYALGSNSFAANDIRLIALNVPNNQFGYFIGSQTQGFAANAGGSQGNLCVAGTIVRFNSPPLSSGNNGLLLQPLDLQNFPTPINGPVNAGETWNFQAWYRDVNPSTTSNFSDGTSVFLQ